MKSDLFILGTVVLIYSFFGLIDKWVFYKTDNVRLKLIPLIGANFLTFLLGVVVIAFTTDIMALSGSSFFYFYGAGYFIISLILKLLLFKRLTLKALLTSSLVVTILFLGAFLLIVEYKLFESNLSRLPL